MPGSNNVRRETETEAKNKAAVQAAFDAWRACTRRALRLLTPDATWTITGSSLAAKTDNSRDEFLDTVIKPFNARLTKPLISTSRKCCGLAVEVGGFTIEERDDQAVTVKTTGTIRDSACASTLRDSDVV